MIQVVHKKSREVSGEGAISYIALAGAKYSRTSTKKYCVTEKETREVITGQDGIDLRFHENRILMKGLNGNRDVTVRVEDVNGASSIPCTFTACLKYTAVHALGLTTSHLLHIDTTFTLLL